MKREVKIGIFAVAMLIAAWAGIRFLKGFDIFSRNAVYYASYDQVNGVESASPIMMRGVKIGTVTGISFDPQRSDNVVLQFTIRRQFRIPTDSEAKIFSNGLMGGKAIEIIYGRADTYLEKGDTLRSIRERDLMDVAGSELDFFKQEFSRVVNDLSRTLGNVNRLLEANAANVDGTMQHLNDLSGDMAEIVRTEKLHMQQAVEGLTRFSTMLGECAPQIDSIVGNLNRLSGELADANFAERLSEAVSHVNALLAEAQAGEGTLGKLIGDPALYDSLTVASGNLASLLADLERYPGRYVHFSLFGRDPEKMQAKAERKAAKAAERAERDSLKRAR
ncbi:MAG TPA: MCE family protein [Candidatus Alistipes intestinipullorum]|nr:MCE family protein [Candidatus Alistipes intestinipullorum]